MRTALRIFLVFTLLAVGTIELASFLQRNRAGLPWTALDLASPPGRFTAGKIADLGDDAPRCRALLRQAGSRSRPAPERIVSSECGYTDGTVVDGDLAVAPGNLVTSCPVAAALFVWQGEVRREAERLLGSPIRRVLHAGSFSCRRLYGRDEGPWSEHATADAVDILGFELADGRTLSVLRDWSDEGLQGTFLRLARDRACLTFTTVLSPDYNEAHRDHLHLDTADRGSPGWRACR